MAGVADAHHRPVRPLLRVHPARRHEPARCWPRGSARSTTLGIVLGVARPRLRVGADGGLCRLGQPSLRSRSAAAARAPPRLTPTRPPSETDEHHDRNPDRLRDRLLPADRRRSRWPSPTGRRGGRVRPPTSTRPGAVGQPAPERPRPGRRLHERGVVPRHRRPRRAQRLRRHDLRHRLAGRLAGADVLHRRAAAQPRQVHLCRCRRVPAAAAAGPDRGGVRRHPHAALLHHRADGRRRQPRHADVRHPVRVGRRDRRRRDAALRAVRRHDRDDLGPDHQGDPAARRRDGAHAARARAVRLLGDAAVRRRAPSATGSRRSSPAAS